MKLNFYEINFKFTDKKGNLIVATIFHDGERIGQWNVVFFKPRMINVNINETLPFKEATTLERAKTIIELAAEVIN